METRCRPAFGLLTGTKKETDRARTNARVSKEPDCSFRLTSFFPKKCKNFGSIASGRAPRPARNTRNGPFRAYFTRKHGSALKTETPTAVYRFQIGDSNAKSITAPFSTDVRLCPRNVPRAHALAQVRADGRPRVFVRINIRNARAHGENGDHNRPRSVFIYITFTTRLTLNEQHYARTLGVSRCTYDCFLGKSVD